MQKSTSIDVYISTFPKETQKVLILLRATIKASAPDAEETIKYGIPTFVLHGNLVHFGGYTKHIGFYPAPSGIEAFQKELSVYKTAKGSIRFPLALITKIVKYRVKENLRKEKQK